MSLNATPSAERVHIGFFGCRNAGKSSIVNAVTGQDLAVVSDVAGTTTDPVQKAMELLPLGPVVIIDTPGFDDEGMLGEKRVLRTKQTLNRCDLAVLVVDATRGLTETDRELVALFEKKGLPYVVVHNKADLLDEVPVAGERDLWTSAVTGAGVFELKERLGHLAPKADPNHRLLADLIEGGDVVVLVCPIDESAPKGRLILPQQMAVRDVLDAGALAFVCRETELAATLASLAKPPALVVTDSQAFKVVDAIVPDEVPLTSFSILMARYKGFLHTAAAGVAAVENLRDGDRVLMAEGCTHHRQCNDIGTVKIPRWLRAHTGAELQIETCSGREFPDDLSAYSLIVHCGGCMITEREVQYRMRCAQDQGVPFTNYGIAIAQMTGALERSVRLFPEVHALVAGA
ncbi:MAG: [FeFe] hydrogenase H-cluster maturation GTPase HydF [Coriobacteriales bacterium]|nr:[FeFe] hydrogenase H-cluster maturation GTPase HydF [Coriobacteriales bacterium]